MVIIEDNVEKTLIQDMQKSLGRGHIQRCLHLNFSAYIDDPQDVLPFCISSIKDYFNDESGHIYICENHDVFVTTNKVPRKQILKFLSYVSPKLSPDSLLPKGLATLFETDINWNDLLHVCKKQYETMRKNKQALIAAQEQKKAAQNRKNLLNMQADPALVATLKQRRNGREHVHVLIIEDDLFTQKLIKKTLPEHHDSTFASNGHSALTLYAGQAPDIVFLDIGLPDITGHDILKKVLHMDNDAFIVMLSGNGDQENVMRAVKAGAKGFIGKPFTKDKINQYLQKSLHIQRKDSAKN